LNAQPIDLFHLARQTGGETALEHAVLRLFAANSVTDLGRLKAASGQARREAAHLIVGSARAIGAEQVARLAAHVEKDEGDVAALEAAIVEAREFIAEYLSQGTATERPDRRSTGSGSRNRL
jgi:HPt (histidine-containing phosphotransfer) domain-containing protein